MNPEKSLIDKAAENCSSYAELARRIGTSKQSLSQMKHGTRDISPETAALLADIANEDAREAVIRAVIERNRTGPKAEQIREILGKALAGGAVAALLICYNANLIDATEIIASGLTMLYIVSIRIRDTSSIPRNTGSQARMSTAPDRAARPRWSSPTSKRADAAGMCGDLAT